MGPQSSLGQPARPLCSHPPLLSFGSTQLERDSFLAGGSSKLGSGLTCLAAPDLPFGAGKKLSLRCRSPRKGGTSLGARLHPHKRGELIRGSDVDQMLLSALTTQLGMVTWSWAQRGPPFPYFLSWLVSASLQQWEWGGPT